MPRNTDTNENTNDLNDDAATENTDTNTDAENTEAPAIVFSFRTKPGRGDNSAMVAEVLNALNAGTGKTIVLGEMPDDAYAAFAAQFATDEGTTILRYTKQASQLRSAIAYSAKQLKRKVSFTAHEQHDGTEWNTVGYTVRSK